MLRNERAQKLCAKWCGWQGSGLWKFSIDGIWKFELHRVYLNEIQLEIDRPETALHPFDRPAKDRVELEQLKHFFEQRGLAAGVVTVWHNDYYGYPVPYCEKEYGDAMKPIHRLI